MEIVLLKSSICLLAFIAFYKVFLERTSNHQFKRIYLLGVVLVSITIPFITFVEYIEPQNALTNISEVTGFSESQNPILKEPTNYLPIVLWSIYGLGVLLFLIRFVYNLSQIALKIRRNPKQKTNNFTRVLLKDLIIPHTFFSYIFFNKTKFENNEIPKEVLLHEQTHAKQKHSLDILFIEVLQILFWFHPLVYLIKKDIKLNHEFLADQAVINKGIESTNYQKILLSFSSNQQTLTLEHAINYSSIKKRFTVMKTQTSKQTFWLRSLLLLPLLAILIFSFSTKKQIEKEAETKSQISNEAINNSENLEIRITKDLKISVNDRVTSIENLQNMLNEFHNHLTFNEKQNLVLVEIKLEDNIEMGFFTDVKEQLRASGYLKLNITPRHPSTQKQDKATPKQLAEYNKLAKKYNNQPEGKRFIERKDVEKLEYIYSLMTEKQKTEAEPFPNFPSPPPVPKVKKGEVSNIPPPPPPIPGDATEEERAEYEKIYEEYNRKYEIKNGHVSERMVSPPPPPPPPIPGNATEEERAEYERIHEEYNQKYEVKNGHVSESMIPPPPPPKPPLDHAIEMAKKDANFYFEGKKITSDEAIAILKKDTDLSISTQTKGLQKPMVNITTQPVITDANGKVITKIETLQDVKSNPKKDRNGYVDIHGTTYFYTVKNEKTTYFNRYGKKVNEKGELIN
ncbi:M56 family metallopeptidase [Lacinutrix cladophorae]